MERHYVWSCFTFTESCKSVCVSSFTYFWQLLMHVSEQKHETEHFKFAQEYALKSMGREKGGGYFELYHVFLNFQIDQL